VPHTSDRQDGCRVTDEWTFRGVRMAVLENDHLRVVIALDRGAEIVEFRSKADDADPLLHLHGGPRDPRATVPSVGASGGSFLDHYAGGWQEIAPNGGPAGSHRGVEYGQHGEISLVPWDLEIVEDRADLVAVRCSVRALRTPFRLERTMTLRADRGALFLDERLTNESGEHLDLMWGHHVAFGQTLLGPGARIWTSATTVVAEAPMAGFEPRRVEPGWSGRWPLAQAPGGSEIDLSVVPAGSSSHGREMAYLSEFDGAAWYAIASPERGFAMRWDGDMFRYLWLWQEFGEGAGYPWWKRVRTVALEPWTSFPTLGLAEAVRRGTQLVLPASGSVETSLVAVSYVPQGEVTGVGLDGSLTFAPEQGSGPR
jgi:galactose mutarotase-like enzyme